MQRCCKPVDLLLAHKPPFSLLTLLLHGRLAPKFSKARGKSSKRHLVLQACILCTVLCMTSCRLEWPSKSRSGSGHQL